MKKIIVPIDFSEESLYALDYASIWANKYKSDVQMVYVQTRKASKHWISEKKEKESVEKQFIELQKKYADKFHKACKFNYIIKKGRVFEEIAEQAEAFDDSMVICTTHGESGWSNFFIGSNTYRIVEGTMRPVISIGVNQKHKKPKTIVMPIDITKETREKVPLVASVAKHFDAEVHILKVTSSTGEGIHNTLNLYAKQVAKYFDERDVKYKSSLIVGDNITDVTIEYAKTVEANLIIIMTEQIKAWTNMLMGSYAQQMLNNSPIPVLSVTPYDVTLKGSSFRTMGG
ncbi:MAG: universal stress protein [Bacteroidales bacterium]|jgi:nucleotide-binding universal stress UspA family protein|nr:universal stress protein [Bacteroidales bacterium]